MDAARVTALAWTVFRMPFMVSEPRHRVLHVFGRMVRGGAEMRTIDLMRQESLKKCEFHFATLGGGTGSLDATIKSLNGHVHPCPLTPAFPRRFRQLIRVTKCDIVHSHVHRFSGYVLRLAHKEQVPARIAHFRSTGDGHLTTLRRRVQRALTAHWLDRHATSIVAVSEGAMKNAWTNDWRADPRCRVIYNGLDLQQFVGPNDRLGVRREFGFPSDCPLLIHVGLLSAFKNQERLVHIFAELRKRIPGYRLLLVGRDSEGTQTRVQQTIAALRLQSEVVIAGERRDVPRLLKAADLMVFPSLREGLPGAVLEACAAGTPVVASDLPGTMEIAARCSLVRCVSLAASDIEWSNAAEDVCSAVRCGVDLSNGPFDAITTAWRLRALYESHFS